MAGQPMNGTASKEAAALLMRDREAIAVVVTEAIYERYPDLWERHGQRGHEKTLQDMRHNIDHLIPAVDLQDASMFARYVEWLDEVLRSRGVRTKDVIGCLELTRDECARRYGKAESDAIAVILDAGLAVVQ